MFIMYDKFFFILGSLFEHKIIILHTIMSQKKKLFFTRSFIL